MIGYMDLFIGTRMHSNIFALSMHVPTVAIGYRHKTRGIMEMLQMENYVCDVSNIRFEDIAKKVEAALANREEITKHLTMVIGDMQRRALYNALLAKKILEAGP